MDTLLYVQPPAPLPAKAARSAGSGQVANPRFTPLPAAEALKQIRKQSCYKTLRSVIEFSMGLLLGILLLAEIAIIIGGIFGMSELGFISIPLTILESVAVLFGSVIVLALRQSSLLLIDIADCQIQTASERKTP